MLVYILIFGVAVIFSLLLLWYFDPLQQEGFQARTYDIDSSATRYSGIGGTTQLVGTVVQAIDACNAAPGCVGFLYHMGVAYLNSGATMKTVPTGPTYDSGANDIMVTCPNTNRVQTVTVNAVRRYIRIGVSRTSPDGYVGLDQVIVTDNNGNNAALGKRCAATGLYDANSKPHEASLHALYAASTATLAALLSLS